MLRIATCPIITRAAAMLLGIVLAALGLHGWARFCTPTGAARLYAPACCAFEPTVNVQVSLEDGSTELVTLTSDDDPARVAADLASRYSLSPEKALCLQEDLALQWADGCENAPPIYVGPMCEDNALSNPVASVELPDVGLVLEVADSVVAPSGRGLFMRCLGEVESVTLEEGTAVCGYAAGAMSAASESDRTVAFALASLDSVVWFERELRAVGELLSDPTVESIAGHAATLDEKGSVVGIALDAAYTGPRYYVPTEPLPTPINITAFGQMANDLAVELGDGDDSGDGGGRDGGADAVDASYDRACEESNALVLVFRLERDAQEPSVLLPTRPISTMARSLTFVNDVPMEIGCRYGQRYWRNFASLDE